MPRKSYWQSMVTEGERSQNAIRAWFQGLAEGMTCDKCEVLCDIDTDREKKLRAFMTNAEGEKYVFTRTVGKRFSISCERLPGEVSVNLALCGRYIGVSAGGGL